LPVYRRSGKGNAKNIRPLLCLAWATFCIANYFSQRLDFAGRQGEMLSICRLIHRPKASPSLIGSGSGRCSFIYVEHGPCESSTFEFNGFRPFKQLK
jgi:hypothetical protein